MHRYIYFFFFAFWAMQGQSQSSTITIDGRFDDWNSGQSEWVDAPESIAGIDLLSFQVTNDEDYLYIHVILDTEIRLLDNIIPQTLYLQIDTDNDPGTGFFIDGDFGSEMGIQFRSQTVYYNVTPFSTQSFSDIRYRSLPSVSSTEFEMAIGRDEIPDGINPLFPSPTIRIMFRETNSGDRMPNVGEVFSYTFDDTPVAPVDFIDNTKQDPEHVRVVAWNAQNNLENSGTHSAFERLVQSMSPDIIAFSEASGPTAAEVKSLMDGWLPTGTPEGWYSIKDDYDHITVSRYPISNSWPALDRQFPCLIDLPEPYQKDLLVVNAHYNCCTADANRQEQADEFVSFILDAKTPGGAIDLPDLTPFVLCGDLNLVGYAQQLETVLTGDIQNTGTWGSGAFPDWDNTPLTDQICRQSDQRMAYTWRNDFSSFPPGRLDFMIYSDAAMTAEKSYSIQTGEMSPARLATFGLQSNDAETVSDHFPIITDFSISTEILDADADGVSDFEDNCVNTPNSDQADFNNDGIGDVCSDIDLDGLTDAEELVLGTDPELFDTDGDGIIDSAELNISGTNPLLADTDSNGCNDLDELSGLCGNIGNSSCPTDLNGDGVTNTGDLVNMLSQMGSNCPD